MKTPIQLALMTDKQYEAYLRRHRFTGLAAARMDQKRRQGRIELAAQPKPGQTAIPCLHCGHISYSLETNAMHERGCPARPESPR